MGALFDEFSLTNQSEITIVALTYQNSRRPLAALRAALFAASFDAGLAAPPVFAIISAQQAQREALVVVKPASVVELR